MQFSILSTNSRKTGSPPTMLKADVLVVDLPSRFFLDSRDAPISFVTKQNEKPYRIRQFPYVIKTRGTRRASRHSAFVRIGCVLIEPPPAQLSHIPRDCRQCTNNLLSTEMQRQPNPD